MFRACSPLILSVLLLGACGGGGEVQQEFVEAQRVILITCDTLRTDRLGVYGFDGEATPNLDAFAKRCVVYDSAYSTASMTMPAFASMMTGLLPDHTGVLNNHVLIPSGATTIAESLSAGGFETSAVVSNWVLRSRQSGKRRGMEQGFSSFDDTMESAERTRKKVKERLAPDTTDAALAWLARRSSDRFFLWVHYQDPHGPYTPPAGLIQPRKRSGAKHLPLSKLSNTPGNIPFYQALGGNQDTDFYQDRYEAEIRFFDRELGRLLNELEQQGLLDDALVIFTADHGESLGEHDWWFSHGQTLSHELVHVPLMVSFPGAPVGEHMRWEEGIQRTSVLVGHVDLFSTILQSAGISASATHGTSLFDMAVEGGRVMSQAVWETGDDKRWRSATDGRWRWVQNAKQELLFDLRQDPGELSNLFNLHPERARDLRNAFEQQLKQLIPLDVRATREKETQEEKEQMQSLGYLGNDEEDG